MKKIAIITLLLFGGLLAGALLMHHKGYDRRIARKIFSTIRRDSRPMNKADEYYLKQFDDLNNKQLKAARKYGIKEPLKTRSEAEGVKASLVNIKSNTHYKVDKLTYSIPYLTNGTAGLLDMIGKNFQDSLKSKGLPNYRIIVTSVLRTKEDIRRLQKSNPNSISNSAHCYATTFDITYARFNKSGNMLPCRTAQTETLKRVLGEVLLDLKKQKRCYVKYEVRQRCFHITTRM